MTNTLENTIEVHRNLALNLRDLQSNVPTYYSKIKLLGFEKGVGIKKTPEGYTVYIIRNLGGDWNIEKENHANLKDAKAFAEIQTNESAGNFMTLITTELRKHVPNSTNINCSRMEYTQDFQERFPSQKIEDFYQGFFN